MEKLAPKKETFVIWNSLVADNSKWDISLIVKLYHVDALK